MNRMPRARKRRRRRAADGGVNGSLRQPRVSTTRRPSVNTPNPARQKPRTRVSRRLAVRKNQPRHRPRVGTRGPSTNPSNRKRNGGGPGARRPRPAQPRVQRTTQRRARAWRTTRARARRRLSRRNGGGVRRGPRRPMARARNRRSRPSRSAMERRRAKAPRHRQSSPARSTARPGGSLRRRIIRHDLGVSASCKIAFPPDRRAWRYLSRFIERACPVPSPARGALFSKYTVLP